MKQEADKSRTILKVPINSSSFSLTSAFKPNYRVTKAVKSSTVIRLSG